MRIHLNGNQRIAVFTFSNGWVVTAATNDTALDVVADADVMVYNPKGVMVEFGMGTHVTASLPNISNDKLVAVLEYVRVLPAFQTIPNWVPQQLLLLIYPKPVVSCSRHVMDHPSM